MGQYIGPPSKALIKAHLSPALQTSCQTGRGPL